MIVAPGPTLTDPERRQSTAISSPLGAQAMTGSGSVITRDVPDEALALGRAQQVTKPGLATRLKQKLREAKAARAVSTTSGQKD